MPGNNDWLGCQLWFAVVLFASIYALVRLIVSSVELRRHAAAELQLEVLALRHEVVCCAATSSALIFCPPLDLWLDHYNCGRPHMALHLLAPDPRPLAATGSIVRERKLFGLTTEYSRAA